MPEQNSNPTPSPKKEDALNEKLDLMVHYLHKMDQRDKMRTWGSFMGGLMKVGFYVLMIWGGWYFYQHSDEMISSVAKQAAQQAASMGASTSTTIIESIDASELLDKLKLNTGNDQ